MITISSCVRSCSISLIYCTTSGVSLFVVLSEFWVNNFIPYIRSIFYTHNDIECTTDDTIYWNMHNTQYFLIYLNVGYCDVYIPGRKRLCLTVNLQVKELTDRSGCDRGKISGWSALSNLYVWTTQWHKEVTNGKHISSMPNIWNSRSTRNHTVSGVMTSYSQWESKAWVEVTRRKTAAAT